ncbi:hypothetical protein PPSIR1_19634 [Plesiocystis pacifica SIR-1]|uniref:Lipoprotein n=2 Tax=Plesiocystis pacifica TaxID=191768 RepID=A6GAM6_9BACT|nr:hypothetical protein PPSIR1_19634 [Plesiocystis pacifica SIR-1]
MTRFLGIQSEAVMKTLNKRYSFLSALLLLPLVALSAAACDGPDPAVEKSCRELAEHMSSVVLGDRELGDEDKKKAVDAGVESCVAEPPTDEQKACVLAAKTVDAIKACDDEKKDGEQKE